MGTWPSRSRESRIWDTKIWSSIPRNSDLRMNALARASSNFSDRPVLSSERILHNGYVNKKKYRPWVQWACCQDELNGTVEDCFPWCPSWSNITGSSKGAVSCQKLGVFSWRKVHSSELLSRNASSSGDGSLRWLRRNGKKGNRRFRVWVEVAVRL
jgi:hypothetical protein